MYVYLYTYLLANNLCNVSTASVERPQNPRGCHSSLLSDAQRSPSAANADNKVNNDDSNFQCDINDGDIHGSDAKLDFDFSYDNNTKNDERERQAPVRCHGSINSSTQRVCSTSQASCQSAAAAASSSSRRQGLGVQPRRFAAIGQMHSHPWFLLNRGPCAWNQVGEQEGQKYAIPQMCRCRGYQIKKFGGTLQRKSERLQLIQGIEDRLSYLNVIFFFKDIFQGNRREKLDGEADVGYTTSENQALLHPVDGDAHEDSGFVDVLYTSWELAGHMHSRLLAADLTAPCPKMRQYIFCVWCMIGLGKSPTDRACDRNTRL
jgi:hypothetical protein